MKKCAHLNETCIISWTNGLYGELILGKFELSFELRTK